MPEDFSQPPYSPDPAGAAFASSSAAPPPMTAYPSPPPLPKKERFGCFRGCLMAVGAMTLLFFGLGFLVSLVAGSMLSKEISKEVKLATSDDDDFTADASGLRETPVCDYGVPDEPGDDETPLRVARIPLTGTINLSGEESGFMGVSHSTATTLRSIRRATEDASVDAILLTVDSGGGGITDSDILYHALRRFKEADALDGRKVVVLMGDLAASGAYYASLPADRILAHPTTITGSIGVIMPAYNVRQLTDKLGIVSDSIQSGANKDILNPMKDLTDEQRAMLQATVDELYGRFAGLVAEHRNIPLEDVRKIADGRIYTARQALELRLIDEIGYGEDAEKAVYELLGSPAAGLEIFEYERKSSLRDLLSSPDFWGAALSRAVPSVEAPDARRVQAR